MDLGVEGREVYIFGWSVDIDFQAYQSLLM